MAIVGCYAAVVESGPVRFTGLLAWVVWGLLHLVYLPGAVSRLGVLQKWQLWHQTKRPSSRILLELPTSHPSASELREDDVVLAQGASRGGPT
jgi:NADH:ubiquinone reductase (H+-translocating)